LRRTRSIVDFARTSSKAISLAAGRAADYDLRIVFEFVQQGGAEAILLLSIGTHDEVY